MDAKEKLNAGKDKVNEKIKGLAFRGMLEKKIPAETRAKFPVLDKLIPLTNYIACGLAVVIVVAVVANVVGGGSSGSARTSGGPSSLDKDSATVVVVTPAIYMRMSSGTIEEINSFPQLSVIIEDNEKVKHDWEIIKKAYNIKIDEQVEDREFIEMVIALSYRDPVSGAIIVASFNTMDEGTEENFIQYNRLRQRWLYLLEDTKGLLPGQTKAQTMLSVWG